MLYMAQHCLKCEARNRFNHGLQRGRLRGLCRGFACGISALHPDPDVCVFPEWEMLMLSRERDGGF